MDAVLEHKSVARAAAFERRKMAKARVECRDACDILCRHVSAFGPANVIAGYMPIQSEIDPLPAMKTLYDQGHTICVPIIQGKGKALLFREWNPDAPLIEGDFGATEEVVEADPAVETLPEHEEELKAAERTALEAKQAKPKKQKKKSRQQVADWADDILPDGAAEPSTS